MLPTSAVDVALGLRCVCLIHFLLLFALLPSTNQATYAVDVATGIGTWGSPLVVKHLRQSYGNSAPSGLALDLGFGVPRYWTYLVVLKGMKRFVAIVRIVYRFTAVPWRTLESSADCACAVLCVFLGLDLSSMMAGGGRTCWSATATATASASTTASAANASTAGRNLDVFVMIESESDGP